MRKNVAGQAVGAEMISRLTGDAFTGQVTVYLVTQTIGSNPSSQAVGSVGSGLCEHMGNGFHIYRPSQAETNFDFIAFTFVGNGAFPSTIQVPTDALTVSITVPEAIAQAAATSDLITCKRGDTLVKTFTLGNISTRTKLWLTVKRRSTDADDAAFLQVTEAGGLITYNGAAASSSTLASLTVVDQTTGETRLTVSEELTKLFDKSILPNAVWDIQIKTSSTITTPREGTFQIVPDITRNTT